MLENTTYLCMSGIRHQKEMRRNVSTFDYVTCKRVDTRGGEDICNLLVSSTQIYGMVGDFF